MSIVDVIAEGLRTGLPHPGDPENGVPAKTLLLPGMNFRSIPKELMEKFAADAGLPSSDVAKVFAEAIVNLIETKGNSDIVARPEPEPQEPIEEHKWSSPPARLRKED